MKNILISGSSGFLGQNLLAYLKGHKITQIVPVRLRSDLSGLNVHNISAIIHLAGKAHDLKNVADPKEYYSINYELTMKLYDSFLQSSATKFIFISSVKAVADHVEDILTEDHNPNPLTHYGRSKLMAEKYIISQSLPAGKVYYILRPCMIHGPGNKGNLNLLFKFVLKGLPYPLAAFKNKRSFLNIENLCFVIKELIERDDILSGIYNIADDDPLSTTEVVSILNEVLKRTPRLLSIPKGIISSLAKLGDMLGLPFNSERLSKLSENYIVSNEKIRKAFNRELPLTAREGISITARSFIENN